MITKCDFLEYDNKENINDINEIKILLIGQNNTIKKCIIDNFIFFNNESELGKINTNNEIYTFIKTIDITMMNYNFNLNIKFVIHNINENPDQFELPEKTDHNIALFVFDVHNTEHIENIIKYTKKITHQNIIKIYIGNETNEFASLINFNCFKNGYIDNEIKKYGNYFYQYCINKSNTFKLFTNIIEKYILNILKNTNSVYLNYATSLPLIIKFYGIKKKLTDQVSELNNLICKNQLECKMNYKELHEYKAICCTHKLQIDQLKSENIKLTEEKTSNRLLMENNMNKIIKDLANQIDRLNFLDKKNNQKLLQLWEEVLNGNDVSKNITDLNELLIENLNIELSKNKSAIDNRNIKLENLESKIRDHNTLFNSFSEKIIGYENEINSFKTKILDLEKLNKQKDDNINQLNKKIENHNAESKLVDLNKSIFESVHYEYF